MNGRRAFLLPASVATVALTTQPSGRYSLASFFATFLQAKLVSTDPNVVAATRPLSDWIWLASTDSLYGGVTRLVPVYSAIPLHQQRLNSWAQWTRSDALAKLGASGPGLTNTAFQQGLHKL